MAKNEALPTQEFVDIDHVEDDIVILKTRGLRKILLVSGVNIELKSEEEQGIIYSEYQNFLNSLDFSLQLVVHSRKLNIQKYLEFLEKRESEEKDDLLKNELSEYREFIRSFVAENDIMTKNFFAVVPFDPILLPSGGGISKIIPDILPSKKSVRKPEDAAAEDFSKWVFQLNQRVEHVIGGLRSIGLRAVALNHEELIELFYNLYNPESVEKEDLAIAQNGTTSTN